MRYNLKTINQFEWVLVFGTPYIVKKNITWVAQKQHYTTL